MKKHLFWILPAIVIITGISLMFSKSVTDVTESPEEGWSRGMKIGTTRIDQQIPVQKQDNGQLVIQTYEDDQLRKKTFSRTFELIDETSYNIPIDKWTKVFLTDDHLIYHDYQDIYDRDGNVIAADASRFYPMDNTILYIKDSILYELDPNDHSSAKIMKLNKRIDDIIPFQGNEHLYFMTEHGLNNDVDIDVYELTENGAKRIHTNAFEIDFMQTVNDIDFAIHDGKLAYMLKTVHKESRNAPQSYTYLEETPLGSDQAPSLEPLTFPDPAGKGQLSEPDNITVSYQDGTPQLLLGAEGATNTKFKGSRAFNIYSATITDSGTIQTSRKSNTPNITAHPQRLNDTAVMWLEQDGDTKSIFVSSSNPAIIDQASGLSQDDWLRSLGKTFGMFAKVLIAGFASILWFIWPVMFIVLMYAIKGRKLDEDRSWFFYTGAAIYLLAAFVFRDVLFVDTLFAGAPDYLTFTGGSPYIYMFLFALIAFISAQSAKVARDWHAAARIIYFAGTHILMFVTFFGPYYF